MKSFLKVHRVWLTTAVVGLVSFFTPSVNAYVSNHPQYAVAVSALWGIAAAWAKSPKQ